MGKKKDAIVISIDKYSMWSLSVPIAYGVNWLCGYNFLPPLLHSYHLIRSIYDRHNFHSESENVSKFINRDFILENSHYSLTEIQHNYGYSLTEITSIVGLIYSILSYNQETISKKIPKIKKDYYKKFTDYTLFMTIGMSIVNLFIDVGKAYLNINYDVFKIPNEIEFIQPVDLQDQDQMDPLKNEVATITD